MNSVIRTGVSLDEKASLNDMSDATNVAHILATAMRRRLANSTDKDRMLRVTVTQVTQLSKFPRDCLTWPNWIAKVCRALADQGFIGMSRVSPDKKYELVMMRMPTKIVSAELLFPNMVSLINSSEQALQANLQLFNPEEGTTE